MNFSTYMRANHWQRETWVREFGVYVADKMWNHSHLVALYHMGPFFAEVYISIRSNRIELVDGVDPKDFNQLESYLNQIDFSSLV